MRMLSIIALSFACVSVATAADAPKKITFEVSIENQAFAITKGSVDGKDMSDKEKAEVKSFLDVATKAYQQAKKDGSTTLAGGLFSTIAGTIGGVLDSFL